MVRLSSEIQIGSYVFDFVNEVEIESGWKDLTARGLLKLPSKLKLDKDKLKDAIKKGDVITIKLGYDDELTEVYKGYVTDIKPSTPIEIQFEDEMWKLKQININTLFKGGDLGAFLASIFPGITIDAFDISMAAIHFNDVNGAKVLDHIKSDYRLYSFFRNGSLVVGKQYDFESATEHQFQLDYNIVSDDLEYKSKDDVKVFVKAISNKPDGKKITVELGEKGGDTSTLNFFNLSKVDLKKAAEKEIERFRYDGFRGDFVAFGEPIVKMGDIVRLIHDEESDKTGQYWIDKVVTTFGMSGFRQKITLGSVT